MMNPWLAGACVLLVLGALLAALKLAERVFHPPAELMRKLLHVGMGLTVLTFPWLFDRQWPVIALACIAGVSLAAIRLTPRLRGGIGTIVGGVNRASLGEIYFPLAVALLFRLSDRDKLLYCVPILIMALADATAALIGIAYGRVRYVTSEGLKSAEGSLAFFAIAFFSVHVPLLLFTNLGRTETLLIAAIIGVLSTLIEAIAWRGLDNLFIPLGAFAFLKLYMTKTTDELLVRLAATLVLLVFALSWRRRSSLDDSALMAAALFGYAALMLGGVAWIVGPAVLFLIHVFAWPRADDRRDGSVFAVLAASGVALIWLALHVRDERAIYFHAFAVAIGSQLAIVGASHASPKIGRGGRLQRLTLWIAAGWSLAVLQSLTQLRGPSFMPRDSLTIAVGSLAGVAAGGLFFFVILPVARRAPRPAAAIHSAGFAAALAASLVAFGYWRRA